MVEGGGGWAQRSQAVDKLSSMGYSKIMKKLLLSQIALAIREPELFSKKELNRLNKIKNLICEKMYTEYVNKRS